MSLIKNHKFSLLSIYIFLFVFLSINREFTPFGVDLRFFLPLIFLTLIVRKIKQEKLITILSNITYIDISIFIFYALIFLCNFSWVFNDLQINYLDFANLMILHLNNFFFILICFLYKEDISFQDVNLYFMFSLVILAISMVLIFFDIPLYGLISNDFSGVFYGGENINGFGLPFRIAGFAQDPNYASCFFVIGLILLWFNSKINIYKRLILSLCFSFCIFVSWSKTMIIALVFGVSVFFILNKSHKYKINIFSRKIDLDYLLLCGGLIFLFIFMAFIPFEKISANSISMSTRYFMWDNAQKLFGLNPIIGNGISSFRSYFYHTNQWYVHCHSSYLQILSEMGILGAISFGVLVFNSYKQGNNETKLILLIFLIWSLTYENIYLQIFVIVFYLNVISKKEKRLNGKSVLFFINSFGQGGAERVCINLAEGYLKQGYNVDFITLYDDDNYQINEEFNVFSFRLKRKSSKYKRLIGMLSGLYKMDNFIYKQENEFGYALISSHLPFSNIISRLSIVSKECLYVMHTPCSSFSILNDRLYKYILKCTFYKRKIVTVSNGVKEEMIERYNFFSEQICTIYNPILIEDIKGKMHVSLKYEKPYFLFVGRLIQSKRVDRLLDIFKKGKYYEKYNLVLVGNGDEENEIKRYAHSLNISDSIDFIGWQDNVYKWMKNAELLILTSDYEAFGMVILEALVTGCKVVSSNCNYGPNEILIDEYKEYLVDNIMDINEYICKINLALEKYPNPTNNQMISMCGIDLVSKQYIEFYLK